MSQVAALWQIASEKRDMGRSREKAACIHRNLTGEIRAALRGAKDRVRMGFKREGKCERGRSGGKRKILSGTKDNVDREENGGASRISP